MADSEDIPVAALVEDKDKLKALMRRDPKFIGRLISQLDKQMHKMMGEKHQRGEAIRADEAALAQLEATIASHITPKLEKLEADIAAKRALRESVAAQLAAQEASCRDLGREVAALVSKARHTSGKLMSKTASHTLREARGFSAAVPTTQLIRGKPNPRAGAASGAAAAATSSRGGQQPAAAGLIGGSR